MVPAALLAGLDGPAGRQRSPIPDQRRQAKAIVHRVAARTQMTGHHVGTYEVAMLAGTGLNQWSLYYAPLFVRTKQWRRRHAKSVNRGGVERALEPRAAARHPRYGRGDHCRGHRLRKSIGAAIIHTYAL